MSYYYACALAVLAGVVIGLAAITGLAYLKRAVVWLVHRRAWTGRDERDAYALWLRWTDTPDAARHRRRWSPDLHWLDDWSDGAA